MIVGEARKFNRVYVSSVHPDLLEQDLRSVFEAFGEIQKCLLAKDTSGRHRGFGYIEFSNQQAAKEAVEGMNGFNFGGQCLIICRAITPPDALGYLSATPPSGALPAATAMAAAAITAKIQATEVVRIPTFITYLKITNISHFKIVQLLLCNATGHKTCLCQEGICFWFKFYQVYYCSVKPIYGAQYPPLKHTSEISNSPSKTELKFRNYEERLIQNEIAACVLERHASEQKIPSDGVSKEDDYVMPNCYSAPSKHHKTQAMQRLATQREPIPGSVSTAPPIVRQNIYPRLPEVSLSNKPVTSSIISMGSQSISSSLSCVTSQQNSKTKDVGGDVSRFDRLRRILGIMIDSSNHHYHQPMPGTIVDLCELRKECWLGIPQRIRPLAWRILSGYIPTNLDRRELTLKRKRDEYWDYVEQYFHTRYDEQHQITFRQIFERILYIWAIRHPASGYVQGINDLVTPFFIVFLSEFIPDDTDLGSFDLSLLNREQVEMVEADSFWCVSALLDTIQDNYTFAQPGIQRKVNDLRELISRVERSFTF
uniref:TBC1 domain family member 22B n=1 Tax=Meloidogyne hapla TaxID=6305 RepID=A0A1I8BHI3_MELHA